MSLTMMPGCRPKSPGLACMLKPHEMEDSVEYRVNEKKEFAKVISFYAKTSGEDGHADVIEVIMNIAESNIADLKAELEQRGWK
ncbi:hypothetical protein N7455_005491 [Penicillium solitum]|uniref:uncharacterized protein n=1 Tax=Penicillium solitum TaxID=60172 RepID=UPI00181C65FC|nr:hypothetical protein HAV15_010738 [Penicillium sp. str. \